MLIGISDNGDRVIARDAIKKSKFFCPSCHEELILKKGDIKIHHFAHKAESICLYAGESLDHLSTKLQIYDALLKHPKVVYPELEKPLGIVRADVAFILQDQTVDEIVIEIQNSPIEISEIDKRNTEYARLNKPILWLLPNKLVPKFNHDMECKTTHWQRYLHKIYNEKIYFHVSGLDVFPLHYEDVVRNYDKFWLAEHDYIETGKTLVNTKKMKMYKKNLNIVDDFFWFFYPQCSQLLWVDDHGLWWNTKDSEMK